MNIIDGAKKAAFLRHLAATGENILFDGRPIKATVGDEQAIPELGAEGEPISGATLSVLISVDAIEPKQLSHGVPLQVRGETYGLEAKTFKGPYYDLTLYKR